MNSARSPAARVANGWLDIPPSSAASEINGVDGMAIMKLDVLSGMDEIKICTGYDFRGEWIDRLPYGSSAVADCKPVYETLAGWKDRCSASASSSSCR